MAETHDTTATMMISTPAASAGGCSTRPRAETMNGVRPPQMDIARLWPASSYSSRWAPADAVACFVPGVRAENCCFETLCKVV